MTRAEKKYAYQIIVSVVLMVVLMIGTVPSQAFAEMGEGSTSSKVASTSEQNDANTKSDEIESDSENTDNETNTEELGNQNTVGEDPLLNDNQETAPTPLEEALLLENPGTEGLQDTNTSSSARPSVHYRAHAQRIGWQNTVNEGETAGTTGQSLRLEALRVSLTSSDYENSSVVYQTHVSRLGWQSKVKNGAIAGTTGNSLAVEAICVNLEGDIANDYDVYYRIHSAHVGWLSWANNGAIAGTAGMAYAAQALEIVLVHKTDESPPSNTNRPYLSAKIQGLAHVQSTGWKAKTTAISPVIGTTGSSRRLESFTLTNTSTIAGSISYSAHVQNIGWQEWVSDGERSGTTGQSKRIEAIRIKLDGDMAQVFDIYYRAHIAGHGWLGWAKNGAKAGTEGGSIRLEAFQIALVLKNKAAPGKTSGAFFKVVPNYRIDAPAISQLPELPTGCEITAVAIMLNGYGVTANKITLARQMPYSGNPNSGYVGNPFTTGGWTIYPSALVGLVKQYTGSAKDLTGTSHATLKHYLAQGKPIVVWTTMHGFGVHAICLVGYNSSGYYYNDPWTGGKNVFMSTSSFDWTWSSQNKRAISI